MSAYGDAIKGFATGYNVGTSIHDRRKAAKLEKEHLARNTDIKAKYQALRARMHPEFNGSDFDTGTEAAAGTEATAATGAEAAPTQASAIPMPDAGVVVTPAAQQTLQQGEAPAADAAATELPAAQAPEAPVQGEQVASAIPDPQADTGSYGTLPASGQPWDEQVPAGGPGPTQAITLPGDLPARTPAAGQGQMEPMDPPKQADWNEYSFDVFSYVLDEGGSLQEAQAAVTSMEDARGRDGMKLFSQGVALAEKNPELAARYFRGAWSTNPDGTMPLIKAAPNGRGFLVQFVDDETGASRSPPMPMTVEDLVNLERGMTMDAKERWAGATEERKMGQEDRKLGQKDTELGETKRAHEADEGIRGETNRLTGRRNEMDARAEAERAVTAREKNQIDREGNYLARDAAFYKGGAGGAGGASGLSPSAEQGYTRLSQAEEERGPQSQHGPTADVWEQYEPQMKRLLATVREATGGRLASPDKVMAEALVFLQEEPDLWEEKNGVMTLKPGVITDDQWERLTETLVNDQIEADQRRRAEVEQAYQQMTGGGGPPQMPALGVPPQQAPAPQPQQFAVPPR